MQQATSTAMRENNECPRLFEHDIGHLYFNEIFQLVVHKHAWKSKASEKNIATFCVTHN